MDAAAVRQDPRGDGARRGPPAPAPLHRRLLPRGLQAPRRRAATSAKRSATRSPTSPRRSAAATARSAAAAPSSTATSGSPSRRSSSPSRASRSPSFVCPGHPLLDATIDLDPGALPRPLQARRRPRRPDRPERRRARPLLPRARDHRRPARPQRPAPRRPRGRSTSSRPTATARSTPAGYAPYLDYRPLDRRRSGRSSRRSSKTPGCSEDLEARAVGHAVAALVPAHLDEVRKRREELVEKTKAAVKDRLTKEINYWDHRAEDLRAQEQAGRTPAAQLRQGPPARRRAAGRLQKRLADLELERQLAALPPVVVGGALVVPAGLLKHLQGAEHQDAEAIETARIERLAMDAVMAAERAPRLRAARRQRRPLRLRHRVARAARRASCASSRSRAATRTARRSRVTRNEILTALNKPDDFILAIVQVDGDEARDATLHPPALPEGARLRRDERELRHRRASGAGGRAIVTTPEEFAACSPRPRARGSSSRPRKAAFTSRSWSSTWSLLPTKAAARSSSESKTTARGAWWGPLRSPSPGAPRRGSTSNCISEFRSRSTTTMASES